MRGGDGLRAYGGRGVSTACRIISAHPVPRRNSTRGIGDPYLPGSVQGAN